MKNFLSKSPLEDLQKIQNNIQLMLTEQRAQRVDLARVIQLVRSMINQVNDNKNLESYDKDYSEEEQDFGSSDSSRTGV